MERMRKRNKRGVEEEPPKLMREISSEPEKGELFIGRGDNEEYELSESEGRNEGETIKSDIHPQHCHILLF